MSAETRPDRRLAPRPVPAHLLSAVALWASSRAALPLWKTVSRPLNGTGGELRVLAGEIEAHGFEPVAEALDAEIADRAATYIGGLEAYRRHPYRRAVSTLPVIWQEGASRLLDYGSNGTEQAVLIVPSLINRYYILDLLPEQSFARYLASRGLRPLMVDWGEPGPLESELDLAGYVVRLDHAFAAAEQSAASPPAIIGYCMGGLLALALALRQQARVAALALLATPWDFAANRCFDRKLLQVFGRELSGSTTRWLSVDTLQSLFLMLDPFLAQRKFTRFAGLDPAGNAARRFVALEDWINDGVPLPIAVARECLFSWYCENYPVRGLWHAAGTEVRPQRFCGPAFVVIPGRDRIVPPASSEALVRAMPDADVLRPPLGHIGMMASADAPEALWSPLARWLAAATG